MINWESDTKGESKGRLGPFYAKVTLMTCANTRRMPVTYKRRWVVAVGRWPRGREDVSCYAPTREAGKNNAEVLALLLFDGRLKTKGRKTYV